VLVSGCLASGALAVEFIRDGTIVLDGPQITNTSDGFVPGKSWQGFLLFPAPITVNAGDTLRGTLGFGAGLLRMRDNGNGFFQVGAVKGFEQLIASATDGGASIISQTNSAVHFTDVRGAALQTGNSRVGGINDDGLFIQVVLDFVMPGGEFFASGGTYRLGFVSGGRPFTFDRISLRVLSEEIGIEPRAAGDLAYRICITGETDSGPSGTDACLQIGSATLGGDNSGLNNLRSIAESPDGKSLYTVSGFDDAIARFDRDGTTGAFSYAGCFTGETESGPAGTGACTLIASATSTGDNSGLDTLQSVAVSADGKSVYTASIGDDAVARFDRDPATGALTYQDCITGEDLSNDTACSKIGSATMFGADSGLDGLRAVALSPDGKSLYAVSPEDDAVARFDRDPATGALTYQGCISGETESGPGPTGSNACTLIGSASAAGANSGLDLLFSIAVSADGLSVYTVSFFDDAVARFDRDPATGALTYQGCISGETESGPAGSGACTLIGSATASGLNSGLDNLFALALSADGKSLYAVAEQDDAVARFDRSTGGALAYQGCITGETQTGPTGTNACAEIDSATSGGTNSGFDKFRSVGVSTDGTSVYAASPADDSVARFDRDPTTGALTYAGCITAEKETGPTGTQACAQVGSVMSFGSNSGLDNPQSFVVSGDGLQLYTASGNDAAVARFDRQPEPPPTTTSTSTTTTTTVVATTSTTTTATTTTAASTTSATATTSITTTTSVTATTATTTSATTTTAPTSSTTTTGQSTTTTTATVTTTSSTTTTTTAPTTSTTSATTTTSPTSTTTTTLPGGCDGLPGLLGAECELIELGDLIVATPDEDLGGVKQDLLKKTNKALRLVRRAQGADGRLVLVNPRKARGALKTFIAIVERRVQRGKIVDVALADELIARAEAIRAQLLVE
jgi:hypothetical protein